MIDLNFKARHLYYMAYFIKDQAIGTHRKFYEAMKNAVAGTTQDEDEVSVPVEPNWVKDMWVLLGNQRESIATKNNNEIANSIFQQLMAAIQNQPNGGQIDTQVEDTDIDGNGLGTFHTVTTYTPERQLLNDMQVKQAELTKTIDNLIATGKGILQ